MEDYRERLRIALKAAMFYADMEPDDVARALGKHVESVRRWTRGETRIEPEDMAEVADLLGVPADLFLRPPATRQEALHLIAAHRSARTGR